MGRSGRRAGGADTRGAILEAARAAFAEHGFERATMRRIAGAAGVDPALLAHYFGSKARLFAAAMAVPVDPGAALAEVFVPGPAGAGQRLARVFFRVWDAQAAAGSPLLGLLRAAATNERAAAQLREALEAVVLRRIEAHLAGGDTRLRATLVASHLVGLAWFRVVVPLEPLASAPADELVPRVGAALQTYIDPPPARP